MLGMVVCTLLGSSHYILIEGISSIQNLLGGLLFVIPQPKEQFVVVGPLCWRFSVPENM